MSVKAKAEVVVEYIQGKLLNILNAVKNCDTKTCSLSVFNINLAYIQILLLL